MTDKYLAALSAHRGGSLFSQLNHLRIAGVLAIAADRHLAQEAGRDVPMLTIFGDDRNGLLIIAGEHSNQRRTAFRLKSDTVADLEVPASANARASGLEIVVAPRSGGLNQ